jgi:ribosomal protein S18 acetylase RimI-like enzyme
MAIEGTIVAVTVEDAEELRRVINKSNREAYRKVIHPEHFKTEILPSDEVAGVMASMSFYGFRHDGHLVGVAALTEESEGVGRMRWVFILPEYQRRGVGTALVLHLEQKAIEAGYRSMKLRTAAGADWAISFYEKLGYRRTGRMERPWGADVLMERPLGPGGAREEEKELQGR